MAYIAHTPGTPGPGLKRQQRGFPFTPILDSTRSRPQCWIQFIPVAFFSREPVPLSWSNLNSQLPAWTLVQLFLPWVRGGVQSFNYCPSTLPTTAQHSAYRRKSSICELQMFLRPYWNHLDRCKWQSSSAGFNSNIFRQADVSCVHFCICCIWNFDMGKKFP